MAKPNFHDRSWDQIDWDTWGTQFSIRDRASSVGELQNGIATRYIEVQNLLSRLPPHAGKARNLVALWRHEVNGYGRTIVFAESARLLKRLDELHGQVTQQLEATRQAAKAARKLKQRHAAPPAPARAHAAPAAAGRPAHDRAHDRALDDVDELDGFQGLEHGAATARQRHDDRPGQETAASRWITAQAMMARECDRALPDTGRAVTNKHFLSALQLADGGAVEQFQHTRANVPVRILRAGDAQFWSTGLPNLEQFGIARYAVYRRDGTTIRFDHAAGIRRPEDLAAEREAATAINARPPGRPDAIA